MTFRYVRTQGTCFQCILSQTGTGGSNSPKQDSKHTQPKPSVVCLVECTRHSYPLLYTFLYGRSCKAKPLYFLAFLATGSLSKLGFSNQIHGSKVWNMEVEAILLQRWLPLLVSMAGGYWVFL